MLELTYKYIVVKPESGVLRGGKPVYDVLNKKSGDSLAWISWYQPWRQFVVNFDDQAVFSTDCLADIQDAVKRISEGAPHA